MGTNKTTLLTYDGMSRCVKIVEKTGTTVTAERNFVWDGLTRCEERDENDVVTRRFYSNGEMNLNEKVFYAKDHLGSVRGLTDSTGATRAKFDYDLWGNRTQVSGTWDTDIAYTGHMLHEGSGLLMAPYRAYNPVIGRWINRDPIGEAGGLNLYGYVGNWPTNVTDPLGLWYWSNPTTWFDGQGYLGSGFEFYRYHDYEQSAAATLDGLIPFADPFSCAYDLSDKYNQMSYVGGKVAQTALTTASGLGIAKGLNAALMPKTLYHFTSMKGGAGIFTTGEIAASNGVYGTGVYLTGFNSATMATIQGAASTHSVVALSSQGLAVSATYWPGTYIIRAASLLLP